MKKILLTAVFLCFTTLVFSQVRIMTVATALSKMNSTKTQMISFLKMKGFKLTSSSDGCYSYELSIDNVKRNIMVCYMKDKVNALAWTEHRSFIDVTFPEVQRLKFMLMNQDPYYHFINVITQQQLNIMLRHNDIFISIGNNS